MNDVSMLAAYHMQIRSDLSEDVICEFHLQNLAQKGKIEASSIG